MAFLGLANFTETREIVEDNSLAQGPALILICTLDSINLKFHFCIAECQGFLFISYVLSSLFHIQITAISADHIFRPFCL